MNAGLLDPSRSNFVVCVGKKGSGKSTVCRLLWESYPYDRLVIDPTGDVRFPENKDDPVKELTEPLPRKWPGGWDKERSSYRFVPDPGAPTYIDDMDRAVGIGFQHGRCMVWVDEMHELMKANKTPPWTRRALNQGRHRDLTFLAAGPRPAHIDPLVLFQADLVYVFELPNVADRERIADSIGWDRNEFHDAVLDLPHHGYLRYDARAEPEDRLVQFPPLPEAVVKKLLAA